MRYLQPTVFLRDPAISCSVFRCIEIFLYCCILGRRSMSLPFISHLFWKKELYRPQRYHVWKLGNLQKKTSGPKCHLWCWKGPLFLSQNLGYPRQPTTSSRPGTGHFLPWNLPASWFVGRELAQWPSIPQEIMMATEVGGWFNSHFLGGDIDPYDSRWGFSQMNPFFQKSK